MARNIELKARLACYQDARVVARRLATQSLGVQHQVDTYFQCSHGRLKLRETEGLPAQLIWYERPNQDGAKASNYLLVEIGDPGGLKAALALSVGIDVVVSKRREIFLRHNVRIHLDRVEGLGEFLEFEAVLGDDGAGRKVDDETGQAQVASLSQEFGLKRSDRVDVSYSDLLRAEL